MSQCYIISRSILLGLTAMVALLGVYVLILTAVSGWGFALSQLSAYRYFIVSLVLGFGIQVGLFSYLRSAVRSHCASGSVLAVSGTTSTAAMLSCCAHYLANILPVIGAAGLITVVSQYQAEFFWVGLASNAAGIFYMASKVVKISTA
jgi:Cu+-exporting ATPase